MRKSTGGAGGPEVTFHPSVMTLDEGCVRALGDPSHVRITMPPDGRAPGWERIYTLGAHHDGTSRVTVHPPLRQGGKRTVRAGADVRGNTLAVTVRGHALLVSPATRAEADLEHRTWGDRRGDLAPRTDLAWPSSQANPGTGAGMGSGEQDRPQMGARDGGSGSELGFPEPGYPEPGFPEPGATGEPTEKEDIPEPGYWETGPGEGPPAPGTPRPMRAPRKRRARVPGTGLAVPGLLEGEILAGGSVATLERALVALNAAMRGLDPAELEALGEARALGLETDTLGTASHLGGIGGHMSGVNARARALAQIRDMRRALEEEGARAMADLGRALRGEETSPAPPGEALARTMGGWAGGEAVLAGPEEEGQGGNR